MATFYKREIFCFLVLFALISWVLIKHWMNSSGETHLIGNGDLSDGGSDVGERWSLLVFMGIWKWLKVLSFLWLPVGIVFLIVLGTIRVLVFWFEKKGE